MIDITENHKKPLLTFVIPVFNCIRYIDRCIQSILSQDVTNIEIMLVDDCSTDGSFERCLEYQNNLNIRVERLKNNSGATTARRLGVALAKGAYIAFLDSDDYVSDNYIDSITSVITEYQPDMISFNHFEVDGNDLCKETIYFKSNRLIKRSEMEVELFPKLLCDVDGHSLPCSLWGSIFRRELILQSIEDTNPSIRIGEDEVCVKTSYYRANSVYTLNLALYYYIHNDSSITKSKAVRPFEEAMLKYKNFSSNIDMQEKDFSDQLNREMVTTLFSISMTQFNSCEKYKAVSNRIKDNLNNDIFRKAITNASFKFGSKYYLQQFLLRYRLIRLLKIYYKKRY